jgi:hypothetical protein
MTSVDLIGVKESPPDNPASTFVDDDCAGNCTVSRSCSAAFVVKYSEWAGSKICLVCRLPRPDVFLANRLNRPNISRPGYLTRADACLADGSICASA